MASSRDLKEVLKESLENRGALSEIKARIRAEVFSALDDQSEAKPPVSNENVLIFELIREFLEYNSCKYTASVLVSESGLPGTPLDREFLRNELNVVEDAPSRSVPLLYSLVSNYKDANSAKFTNDHQMSQSLGIAGNQRQKDMNDDRPSPFVVKGRHI